MIRKIMCCCGSGLGSSMLVRMNVETVLKTMGVTGVTVEHTSISDVSENSADLFVVGKDLANVLKSYPRVVVLDNLMNKKELETKLREEFDK